MSDNDNFVCACRLVLSYTSLFDNNRQSFKTKRPSEYKCMTLENNITYIYIYVLLSGRIVLVVVR